MHNYSLLNHFNKFDIWPKLLQYQAACVRFDKKIKINDLFKCAEPDEQIILTKLSHRDKIKPPWPTASVLS